ncbi:MAG: ATP-binding protein [Ilumatobacteraceae bacterium]
MTKPAALSRSTAADIRHAIAERMATPVSVWSLNGRDIGFQCSFDEGLEVGGFAGVRTPAGELLLVQVLELTINERESMRVAVDTDFFGEAAAAALESANVNLMMRYVVGTARVLSAVDRKALVPPSGTGFREGALERIDQRLVATLLQAGLGKSVGLPIGTVHGTGVDAELKAAGFSRHTFMVGQSGSGKTYSLGAILERLHARTTLPMIIIDPNSDHVHLGQLRDRDAIARRGQPPISRKGYAELKTAMKAAGEVAVARAGAADYPLAIHLSDLAVHEQALTLDLDPLRDSAEYAAFFEAVESLAALPAYGFDEVIDRLEQQGTEAAQQLLQRIRNLRVAEWEVWARPDSESLVHRLLGVRSAVLDTGSLEDARARSVVALAVLGFLRRRAARTPILVVIDEAHNVLSPDFTSALEREIVDYGVWVAGEGRKYGVHLVVSTQRPQKIHRNVISQCDNLVLMRMNSVLDIEELAATFSHVPRAMIAEARSFVQGEMVVAGPIATPPMRVDVGERWCPEGGADLPTTWATRT